MSQLVAVLFAVEQIAVSPQSGSGSLSNFSRDISISISIPIPDLR